MKVGRRAGLCMTGNLEVNQAAGQWDFALHTKVRIGSWHWLRVWFILCRMMSLWILVLGLVVLHLIAILVLNFFHVFHCLFNDQISGGTKIFWMAIIFLVPFVGSLFYALFCSKSQGGKHFALANLVVFSGYILAVFYFSIFGLPDMGLGKDQDGIPLLGRYFKDANAKKERNANLVKETKGLEFKREDRVQAYVDPKNLDGKKYAVPAVRLEGVGSVLKPEQWRNVREAAEMLKLEVTSGWTDDEKRVAVETLEYYNYLIRDDLFSAQEYQEWMQMFDHRKSLAPGFSHQKMKK